MSKTLKGELSNIQTPLKLVVRKFSSFSRFFDPLLCLRLSDETLVLRRKK